MNYQPHFKFVFATLVVLGAAATLSMAQTPSTPLSIRPIRGGIYWTQGGDGGNTGFIIGTDGVLVIDAKTTPNSAKEMLAGLAKLTSKPVTHVILTHSDADHVNGLAAFPKDLTIIAQEGCKKEMEESLTGRLPAPRDYFPTHTVGAMESLKINGVRVELRHWANAHTSGDLITYLPDLKIAFIGDIVSTNQVYTGIHPLKNGSSAGWIETVKGILALDADTIVPGHGDLQTKADLEKRLASVQDRRAKIQQLVAQGKSLDEVWQTLGVTEKAGVMTSGAPYPTFTEIVYEEFAKK
jgi:cyclase